jgi:hypothetical protein
MDPTPVLAADVVFSHVSDPSGFKTLQLAGGKAVVSKPSVTGAYKTGDMITDFLAVSLTVYSSGIPLGSAVKTVSTCDPDDEVMLLKVTTCVEHLGKVPAKLNGAIGPLSTW